jgi:UDP-N-acetyl-alpha-D-muramoyl-L-alanyl-L-glutamate epimerase
MNYKNLRIEYPKFYYKSYIWEVVGNDLNVVFQFSAGDEYIFAPKLSFKNIDADRVKTIHDKIDNLIFNIGMVELLSYWKAFASPEIVVECGNLDDYQINWWHDLLINGMSQFFYENGIDFTENNFVKYFSLGEAKNPDLINISSDKLLVPIGGGKDSSVTAEILSNNFKDVSAFLLNPSKASLEISEIAGLSNVIVERTLDNKILELNEKGFLNGHTPFTTLLSFISVLSAVLGNFGTIIFSNERSSDEENIKYKGKNINHQYSKTFDFENKFREYNLKYLSNVNYFSFLRPIYDIQIAKIFSKFDKYFSVIRSCNVGQKTNSWCGKCPKCLSTFILLYPFLKENTIKIFGKNLLEDKKLDPILNSLINDNTVKPFECVGTREEIRLALKNKVSSILNSWGKNNLDDKYERILKEAR